jgi:ribosome-binding factor A
MSDLLNEDSRFQESIVRLNGVVDITSIQCNKTISVVSVFYDVMFFERISKEEKTTRLAALAKQFQKVKLARAPLTSAARSLEL